MENQIVEADACGFAALVQEEEHPLCTRSKEKKSKEI